MSRDVRVPFVWPSGAEDVLEVRNDGRSALRQVLAQCEMRAVDCTEELMPRLVDVVSGAMRRKGWNETGTSDVSVPLSELQSGWAHALAHDNCQNIARRSADSLEAEEFMNQFVRRSLPLIITGALPSVGVQNWTLAEWRRRYGNERVLSHVSDGAFDVMESASLWERVPFARSKMAKMIRASTARFAPNLLLVKAAQVPTTLNSFLASMQGDGRSHRGGAVSPVHYLQYTNFESTGELKHGLHGEGKHMYPFARTLHDAADGDEQFMLWFGAGDTHSPLHKDAYENLNAVVAGEKSFLMFDPSSADTLQADTMVRTARLSYRNGRIHRDEANIADVTSPGATDRFPAVNLTDAFAQVRRFGGLLGTTRRHTTCTLRAGEVLYQPGHWMHEVRSAADGEGKSIALNYFFPKYYERYGSPTGKREADKSFYVTKEYAAAAREARLNDVPLVPLQHLSVPPRQGLVRAHGLRVGVGEGGGIVSYTVS